MRAVPYILMAVLTIAAVAGCTDDPVRQAQEQVTIEGTVTALRDESPVDGEVTVDIAGEPGAAPRRAYLRSLFRSPPPDDAELATHARIMAIFRVLEVGDIVAATGVPDEGGLRLEELVRR